MSVRVMLWLTEKGGGRMQLGCPPPPLEIMIARLLRATQEDPPAEEKVPLEAGTGPPSVVREMGIPGQSVDARDMG